MRETRLLANRIPVTQQNPRIEYHILNRKSKTRRDGVMDERSLQGLLSNLIPDEIESLLNQSGQQSGEQQSRAVDLLKTAAGQAGGEAGDEIHAFLNGSGRLFETTRVAAAHGGASVSTTVSEFLTKQLNLSPALARIIAPLVVNLLPGVGGQTGSTPTTQPKPKRKTPRSSASSTPKKPKSSASAKPASHAAPKKPKSSTSSKPKTPKASTSSTAKKPKSSANSKPKKPTSSSGKKPAAKAGEIPES
jgi:hypothetical protein